MHIVGLVIALKVGSLFGLSALPLWLEPGLHRSHDMARQPVLVRELLAVSSVRLRCGNPLTGFGLANLNFNWETPAMLNFGLLVNVMFHVLGET